MRAPSLLAVLAVVSVAGCSLILAPVPYTGGPDGGDGGTPDGGDAGSDSGVVLPVHCQSNTKDFDESDTDCGGSCGGCADALHCTSAADCASGECTGGLCTRCSDGQQNAGESDVDCGGACGRCGDLRACADAGNCASGECSNGRCTRCGDGNRDAGETDLDCGGFCGGCAALKTCAVAGDCLSNECTGGTCTRCHDNTKDDGESDIDCGGGHCSLCAVGRTCNVPLDCADNQCLSGLCHKCNDAVKNATETDVDCGGACTTKCADGKTCQQGSDCASGECIQGICATVVSVAHTTYAASSLSAGFFGSVAGFAVGDQVLVHQTRGSSSLAGQWELAEIDTINTANNFVGFSANLAHSFTGDGLAQVVLVTDLGSNPGLAPGRVLTAPAWDGTSGGILAVRGTGTFGIAGKVTMSGRGFRGGANTIFSCSTGDPCRAGFTGESWVDTAPVASTTRNESGGGGGEGDCGPGGGGGNGTDGTPPSAGLSSCIPTSPPHLAGQGGLTSGNGIPSTKMFLGGAGGQGRGSVEAETMGGNGGGIIVILFDTAIAVTGQVEANGTVPAAPTCGTNVGGSGGGAGGAIVLQAISVDLGAGLVRALGAAGGAGGPGCPGGTGSGGAGGDGVIEVDGNPTGTTNPAFYAGGG